MTDSRLFWPLAQSTDALRALARASELSPRTVELPAPDSHPGPSTIEEQDAALGATAQALGLELLGVASPHGNLTELLKNAGPAIFAVPGRGLLLLLAGGARRVTLLGTDLRTARRPRAWLRELLCAELESPHRASVATLLEEAQVTGRRRARATRILLAERLMRTRLETVWLLRLPATAGLAQQAHNAGLGRRLGQLIGAYALAHACGLAAFALLGQAVLSGRLERGWLAGCLLLLLSALPLRALAAWQEESLATSAGALLKRRLLGGALALAPERLRSDGVGRLAGRVLESEVLERFLSSGGLGLILAAWELVLAALLLLWTGSGRVVMLLALWLLVCLRLAWGAHRRRSDWAASRLDLTQQLVERMVGHRTRLAQEPVTSWHDAEDQAVESYHEHSQRADRERGRLEQLAGRGFVLLGLTCLLPTFVLAPPDLSASARLGIGLWGVLLCAGALGQIAQGLQKLSDALVALRHVAPLLADQEAEPGPLLPARVRPTPGATSSRLSAHQLELRRIGDPAGEPLLRDVSLTIHTGDRLLLEGPSGGGKSTLAAVLAGLREPSAGLLLLGGRDQQTLGAAAWRKRVALAPQYHENHVLSGSLAFNLLLGRAWPPSEAELESARAVCEELGLGPLIARMPAGLQQMLGETGWQLSQGERSRLYLARALLQQAEVVILDESLAALDPETLVQVAGCVLRRAGALLAIVHP